LVSFSGKSLIFNLSQNSRIWIKFCINLCIKNKRRSLEILKQIDSLYRQISVSKTILESIFISIPLNLCYSYLQFNLWGYLRINQFYPEVYHKFCRNNPFINFFAIFILSVPLVSRQTLKTHKLLTNYYIKDSKMKMKFISWINFEIEGKFITIFLKICIYLSSDFCQVYNWYTITLYSSYHGLSR
jgi:hypothetical protein